MANQYTLDTVKQLGEYDPKYGARYWATTQSQVLPLMFNSMERGLEAPLDITAEEVLLKTSAKGTEYHQLKKVRVAEKAEKKAVPNIDHNPTIVTQLARIEAKLDKLLGQDTVVEVNDDQDEKDLLNSIPF